MRGSRKSFTAIGVAAGAMILTCAFAAVAWATVSPLDVNHPNQVCGDVAVGSDKGGDTQVFNNGPNAGFVNAVAISGDPDHHFTLGPATTCDDAPSLQFNDQQQCNVSV